MGNLLMVHGTCKNRFICAGNNGTAAVTAGTTACLLGRKRETNLVISLSSIMENGHFSVFMASRFSLVFSTAHWLFIWFSYFYLHIWWPNHFEWTCSCFHVHRNLLLLLFLLSILPCNFMVGYLFSSLYTTNCLWIQIRGLTTNIRACGTSTGSCQWTLGFGVVYFTAGKWFWIPLHQEWFQPLAKRILVDLLFSVLTWYIATEKLCYNL